VRRAQIRKFNWYLKSRRFRRSSRNRKYDWMRVLHKKNFWRELHMYSTGKILFLFASSIWEFYSISVIGYTIRLYNRISDNFNKCLLKSSLHSICVTIDAALYPSTWTAINGEQDTYHLMPISHKRNNLYGYFVASSYIAACWRLLI